MCVTSSKDNLIRRFMSSRKWREKAAFKVTFQKEIIWGVGRKKKSDGLTPALLPATAAVTITHPLPSPSPTHTRAQPLPAPSLLVTPSGLLDGEARGLWRHKPQWNPTVTYWRRYSWWESWMSLQSHYFTYCNCVDKREREKEDGSSLRIRLREPKYRYWG